MRWLGKKDNDIEIDEEDDIFAATDVFSMGEKEVGRSKKKIYRKPTFWIIAVIGLVLIMLLFMIGKWFSDGMQTKKIMKEIGEYKGEVQIIEPESEEEQVMYKVDAVDIYPMIEKNNDTVGYLQYSHFNIAYPLVQSSDNIYYLEHNFEKQQSSAGWVYVDCNNDMSYYESNMNIVVYGHNMLDGSMFSPISGIKGSDVKNQKDRLIVLQTKDRIYVYEVFSSYVTDVEFNYIQTAFGSNEEYENFLESIKKKNEIKELNDIEVTKDDRVLTLSTCSGSSDRRAVHAKLIEVQYK